MECYKRQLEINELKDELACALAKLRYQDRTSKEGPFKSSTPSSKIPIKPNSLPERQAKKGGGKVGHKGHGRRAVCDDQADRQEVVPMQRICPDCKAAMEYKGTQPRSVIDYVRGRLDKTLYRQEICRCPRCRKVYSARPAGVLSKSQYGNGLLTHVAVEHYLFGRTLGQLEQQLGIGCGSLINAMHGLAKLLEKVPDRLIEQYRMAPVKHADETGWRNDGQNGYAWGFFTNDISIFRLRKTRSASVAREVFGEAQLPGVLVVDRYNGYNKLLIMIQYCYAHLLRTVKDLEKDFPDQPEVKLFVETLGPLLATAMQLRNVETDDGEFKKQARRIVKKIKKAINASARHPAVQNVQDIFRTSEKRLYHWAKDRLIPAENNLAERNLRSLVIARKNSFGSQSERGARTRETLMTVLHTLKKKNSDVQLRFKQTLDQLAADSSADAYKLLFRPDTS
ncbi:MAG: IS66 family transposase [bacterium]|nr:IS66 family transposase [bacterium]